MTILSGLVNRIAGKIRGTQHDDMLAISAKILSNLNNRLPSIRSLADVEFKVHSQWGEDGIIDWLVHTIAPDVEYFVEFGVEDYTESNTRYLLKNRNWRGLVIDGSQDYVNKIKQDAISWRHDITALADFITAENIMKLFSSANVPARIGLLSIDIDGMDWWVAQQITTRADIIVCEYNHYLGDAPIVVPYAADFQRLKVSSTGVYYGASLAAWRFLFEARDYKFVGTNSAGTNAFFVDAKNFDKIAATGLAPVAWPCRVREARLSDGKLAYATLLDMLVDIGNKPVLRVDTLAEMSLREALAVR